LLPVAHSDPAAGTILLIVRASGASTRQICALRPGDHMFDVAGPLGQKIELRNFGHAVVLGKGEGTAFAYSLATGLKACANRVTAIIGARERIYVILESELNQVCDAVYPCTDDGSYGFSGPVTRRLQQLIDAASPQVNAVFASGPTPLLQAVTELTRPYGIHTVASLDPPVIDETDLHGG
jgi:ferredoxin--NADP+ reductase